MAWEPEQDAMLRKLALGGLSASRAAETLNAHFGTAFTRCAAIGRLFRLGDGHFKSTRRKERPERRKAAILPVPEPIIVAPIIVAPEPSPAPEPTGVGFFDLPRFGACRWPLASTDGGIENFLFCAEPVEHDDCPYCERHARIAYRPLSGAEKRGNWSLRRNARALTTGAF